MSLTEQLVKTVGGPSKDRVINDANKPRVINPEFAPSQVRIYPSKVKEKDRVYRCCMCGKEYTKQSGNFVTSSRSPLWKGNGGYIPFCRACCEVLMNDLTSFYSGNEEHALKHLCQMFDWYYDIDASTMTLMQVHTDGSRATLYPSKASTRQVSSRGETYLDTIRDDVEKSKIIMGATHDEVKAVEDDEDNDFVVTKEMIRTWGPGFTADQYRYLEEEYQDWIAKNVCNTKSQEELFRNIVLAQLDIRIARQTGGKLAEAQKALQNLMSSANILPRQTTENVLADTQTFTTLLKKFEETDPVPEPSPRWKDKDGIRRYINTWFRGGLAKALKIKNNDNAKLYEEALEEMEKYTVRPKNNDDGLAEGASIFENNEAISEGESSDGVSG